MEKRGGKSVDNSVNLLGNLCLCTVEEKFFHKDAKRINLSFTQPGKIEKSRFSDARCGNIPYLYIVIHMLSTNWG